MNKVVDEMKVDQDKKYERIENKFKEMVLHLSSFVKIADVSFPHVQKESHKAMILANHA